MTTDPSASGAAGRPDDRSAAIDELAEQVGRATRQTNLLLLEATLDMADAAERGDRCLTTAAREVKQLAERTRLAAQRIDMHRDKQVANDTV